MRDPERTEMILCYGRDAILLETRQRVLERIGVPVAVVSAASDFRAAVREAEPALILLCQSLSSEECTSAAYFASEHSPASKVLVMYVVEPCCVLPQEHEEFFSMDGPAALVKTVNRMIYGAMRAPAHPPLEPYRDRV
ncbi:MAG TPA: hypothetical protein VHU44_05185 [Acidobacteriaceae bacterium]|jgi:hypothetical protein|nr:hypothetical protein [Acidobacteriaceae bacterium]